MNSHTCVPKPITMKNNSGVNHQARCAICNKFMPTKTLSNAWTAPAGVNRVTNGVNKDSLIARFRKETCSVTYMRDGYQCTHALSLDPKYLSGYVGKGTSKKADTDTLFLYDVDNQRFRKINVNDIISVVTL